jgi:hypothetical protein
MSAKLESYENNLEEGNHDHSMSQLFQIEGQEMKSITGQLLL